MTEEQASEVLRKRIAIETIAPPGTRYTGVAQELVGGVLILELDEGDLIGVSLNSIAVVQVLPMILDDSVEQ